MQTNRWPLLIAGLFLFTLISVEIYLILKINSGTFTYTLDDPYIHLALADQIANGHYGLNGSEFSAPSSSIIWPFILAITAQLPFRHLHPLFVNLFFAVGTILLFWQILSSSIDLDNQTDHLFFTSILLIAILLGSNLVGIVLSGMEHTSQLFFVMLTVWGMVTYIQEGEVRWWLLVAVFVSPLVRYENLPLSGGVILFLMLENRVKPAFISGGILATCLVGFSLFLVRLGLWALPTSVVAKTTTGNEVSFLQAILGQFQEILAETRAVWLLVALLIILLRVFLYKDSWVIKKFGMVIGISIVAHLLFGKYGWYHRYEIYIWATALVSIIYLYRDSINNFLNQPKNTKWGLIIILISALSLAAPYLYGLTTIPTANNNIYEQQYQMHRFVTEYYHEPVAVNDIGYVSFQNNDYVLDLWGLASIEALQARQNSQTADWMVEITDEYQVELVMVHEDAFETDVPDSWIEVAQLTTSRPNIIVPNRTISFFATNHATAVELESPLTEFAITLPEELQFILIEP